MFDTYEDIFAARADSYHRAMALWPRARDAEFQAVLAPLGELAGRSLYDLPAGGGYLSGYLPAEARYLAVEPAALFVDACPVGHNRERVAASIDAVPRADGSADCLVSLAGLHHTPDLRPVFAEMRRLVRAGGRVVIADVAEGTPQDRFLNVYVHDNNPMGHEGRFLDAATAPLIEAAGLAIDDDALVAIPWRFATRDDAGRYCSSLFGIEGRTPEEVTAALLDICGGEDGPDGVRIDWALRRITCTPS